MSHFYGTLNGSRGEATRCGTRISGLTAVAASYEGAVRTTLSYNSARECDWATVELTPWGAQGCGTTRTLYNGPVSGLENQGDPHAS